MSTSAELLDVLLDGLAERVAAKLSAGRPAETNGDEWLAVRELPERRAVMRAIRSRELHACRPGKRLLVRRADLDAWIRSHPVQPRPQAAASDQVDPIERAIASGKLRRIGGAR